MNEKTEVPDDTEMEEILQQFQAGNKSNALRFMRGCIYRGAIKLGKTQYEAFTMATSEHVSSLVLDVKVE